MQQNRLHVSVFVARFSYFERLRLIGGPKKKSRAPFWVPTDPMLRWLWEKYQIKFCFAAILL
jgi:hypothetical protein